MKLALYWTYLWPHHSKFLVAGLEPGVSFGAGRIKNEDVD